MRYVMKQKLWALGDDFTIKDEAGNDRFFVDGKALSLGDKLSFQDMTRNEMAYVQQKLLSWVRPTKSTGVANCTRWSSNIFGPFSNIASAWTSGPTARWQ